MRPRASLPEARAARRKQAWRRAAAALLLACLVGSPVSAAEGPDLAALEGFSLSFYDGSDQRIDYFGQKIETAERSYVYEFVHSSQRISVNARAVDPQQDITVAIDGEEYALFESIPLPEEDFTLTLVLSLPEESATSTYSVSLKRAALSDDAGLAFLSYGALRDDGSAIQNDLFDQEIVDSETLIEVPHSSEEIAAIPFARHPAARILYEQDAQWVPLGFGEAVRVLMEGKDRADLVLQVQAEDGSSQMHTLSFVKREESGDAGIRDTLVIFFDSDGKASRTLQVAPETSRIALPAASGSYALRIDPVDYASRVSIFRDGQACESNAVFEGPGKFTIVVTAESGRTATYLLEITSGGFGRTALLALGGIAGLAAVSLLLLGVRRRRLRAKA